MKKLILIIGCLASSMAHAQQAAPQPVAEFTVKLTGAEVDIVGNALGRMPYQDVALIIQKLRQQIVEQQNKPVDKDQMPSNSSPKPENIPK